MKSARRLAAPLLALVSLAAQAMPGQPLTDDELSQVHAAGLPEPALRDIAAGVPLAALEPSLPLASNVPQDLGASLERQQALSQLKLAGATVQGSLGLMQLAALPALMTPFAPLVLPTLAMPFPFFMAPPPKKPEPGH
ncbi:MAG TPA: hypothetical protein VJ743_13370 [Albitalea sp.]|nr:hypothetical protein [Albitalea sp.]